MKCSGLLLRSSFAILAARARHLFSELELFETLRPRGVLFCSNPRGNNEEGFGDGRYGCFFDLDTWRNYVRAARFYEVGHYYRPPGLACHQQPWLATVWRKG